MNVEVHHHTAVRSHHFTGAVTIQHLAGWADMATRSLLEEMREQLGEYWLMKSHTVDYPTINGRQCAVMLMVGEADVLTDDDDEWWGGEDEPTPAPALSKKQRDSVRHGPVVSAVSACHLSRRGPA